MRRGLRWVYVDGYGHQSGQYVRRATRAERPFDLGRVPVRDKPRVVFEFRCDAVLLLECDHQLGHLL